MLKFEWDNKKAKQNITKHKISFEEAETIFYDENARLINDPGHSDNEARFILLGISYKLNTLVVCHCYKEKKGTIRIITARKATKKEQTIYMEFLK